MIQISDQELLSRFAVKQLIIDGQNERIAQLETIVENQRLRIMELEGQPPPQAEPIPEGEAPNDS